MISPELLRRFPFFGFMNDKQLKAVAMITEDVILEKDETVVEAGKPADALFFLIDGSLSYYYVIRTEHDPTYYHEYYINDIGPGDIVGISTLIEPYQYTSTVRVATTCRVIKINAQALRALCEVDLYLANGLLRAVARAAMDRIQNTRIHLIAKS